MSKVYVCGPTLGCDDGGGEEERFGKIDISSLLSTTVGVVVVCVFVAVKKKLQFSQSYGKGGGVNVGVLCPFMYTRFFFLFLILATFVFLTSFLPDLPLQMTLSLSPPPHHHHHQITVLFNTFLYNVCVSTDSPASCCCVQRCAGGGCRRHLRWLDKLWGGFVQPAGGSDVRP